MNLSQHHLLLMAIFLLLVPVDAGEVLMWQYGVNITTALAHPLFIKLLRSFGWIAGAWLAATIVAKRAKRGLGEVPPFKDFP